MHVHARNIKMLLFSSELKLFLVNKSKKSVDFLIYTKVCRLITTQKIYHRNMIVRTHTQTTIHILPATDKHKIYICTFPLKIYTYKAINNNIQNK